MPDRTVIIKVDLNSEDSNVRGVAGGIWAAMSDEQREEYRQHLKTGIRPELAAEIMADRITVKDQQFRVNPDENDPNPLSPLYKP